MHRPPQCAEQSASALSKRGCILYTDQGETTDVLTPLCRLSDLYVLYLTLQREAARLLALTARRRPVLVPRKVKEKGPLEREWYVSITDLKYAKSKDRM